MGNVSEKDEFYEKERKAKEAQCLESMKKSFPNHDELDLTRFLLARNYDMKKSKEMYENYLDWKKNYKPGSITIETFEKELLQNRAYFMGHAEDNSHAPIFYFIAKNHFSSPQWQDTVHFGCVIHDAFVAIAQTPGSLTFNGVVDLHGVSIDNIDMKLIKRGIEIYQDYFPERMGHCYVIGLPGSFIGLWHIIEGLLDERTRKRVVLLKESQKITEYILPHLLPKEIGGDKDLSHNEFLEIVKSHYSKVADSQKDG